MIRLTALADTKAAPLIAAHATIAAVSITQVHNLQDLVKHGNPAQFAAVWVLAAVYLLFRGDLGHARRARVHPARPPRTGLDAVLRGHCPHAAR